MSIVDYLPRLGLLDRPARQPRHSAPAEAERLRNRLTWADLLIKAQRVQLDDAAIKETQLEQTIVRQQASIDDLTAERDHLAEQVTALRLKFGAELAAEANANAITVPLMVRDTTAIEDQATGPIPVITLQQAFGSTDPAHVPAWATRG